MGKISTIFYSVNSISQNENFLTSSDELYFEELKQTFSKEIEYLDELECEVEQKVLDKLKRYIKISV